MKNLYHTIILILLFSSCLEENSYEIPEIQRTEPNLSGLTETTFKALTSAYNQAINNGNQIATIKSDLYVSGYVISSDKAGNFYKELIIQNISDDNDSSENPRLGLKLIINSTSLFQTFPFGEEIYIKLNGLSIGKENGVFILGKADGNNINQIQEFEINDFIIRTNHQVEITPKITSISELEASDLNTYVQIENLQFLKNQLGKTYAGEARDQYVGFRALESCIENQSIQLQTSVFADFKSVPIESYRGTIKGIYSRDFNDEIDILIINSPLEISFTDENRCDPIVLDCNGETTDENILFNEDFQSITNINQLSQKGWININTSGGNERYELSAFAGNQYLKISAYGTNESMMEAWLVSPQIDLTNTSNEELSIEISSNFESGQLLTVYITTDFTGLIETTEWIELDAIIPIGNDGFGDFIQSNINLSCINDLAHIAFKYKGSSGSEETRYHIDNIKITGKQ